VIPGTGILLQNRGAGFALDPEHPNHLARGKRTFHTLMPGFLTQDGKAVGPFGVMGGHMQPQGHAQMIVNTVDHGMDPQSSLDAPRWTWWQGKFVNLEPDMPPAIVEGLAERGHEIKVDTQVETFGRGQIIWRMESGVYIAGSDNRADGCAAAW
jgi:gamma-glutamyltranspeptidase/glutathione hydrolase